MTCLIRQSRIRLLMVIWSDFHMEQYRDDDQQENAYRFIIVSICLQKVKSLTCHFCSIVQTIYDQPISDQTYQNQAIHPIKMMTVRELGVNIVFQAGTTLVAFFLRLMENLIRKNLFSSSNIKNKECFKMHIKKTRHPERKSN